ncbi:MAG TPA: imidazolonepropionase, partial [Ohtaekwangia sp.]|nr:imidazolonepropionase [Ohtaekwangia sp.]
MTRLLIKNIKGLVQVREDNVVYPLAGKAMAHLPIVQNAYILLSGEHIEGYGPMEELPSVSGADTIDATGCFVFPSFTDSHTHLVFAASREEEFVLKIRGATYQEIAARGGGILHSARKLQEVSEDELLGSAMARAREIMLTGTGAVEIKSGYGLTVKDELKMLRVARRIGHETPLSVKTTFLGAHAVPDGFTRKDYVAHVVQEMIPAVAAENLADYI